MKFLISAFSLALLLVIAGCDKTNPTTNLAYITFDAHVSPMYTRAPQMSADGSGTFQTGDQILLVGNTNSSSFSRPYNIGAKLYWENLSLPSGTQNVAFSAMYPYQTVSNPATFEFNVSTAENKDLLCAAPVNVPVSATSGSQLTFKHVMHKFVLNYTIDETYTEDELKNTTTLFKNLLPVAVVNLLEGKTVSAKGTAADVSATGKSATFFIAPQAVAGKSLSITIGGKTYDYTFPKQINGKDFIVFEEGKIITCNLLIKKNEVKLLSFAISGWGNQGTIDDEIAI